MPKAKKNTRTFSMSNELVEALEKEAQSRGVSTSGLLNETLERSIKQIWPSEKTGVLSIARDIIHGFLSFLSEEEVAHVATSSAHSHKDRALILYGTEQRLEPLLEFLDINTGRYCRWYQFSHVANGRDHSVLLNHGLGRKWSIFLESYMKEFFLEILDIPINSSITENTVKLDFRK